MNRNAPRKPSVPLATITFRAAGGVDTTVEQLSPIKEELELTIVRKFVASLGPQWQPTAEPQRADPWPDVEVTLDGRAIGIEVVEVIDPEHAQKRAIQERYLDVLLPLLRDLEKPLDQVVVTVVDGYQEPRWPHPSSPEGQRLVAHVAKRIRDSAGELAVMPPSARFHRAWNDFEDSSLQIGLLASRGQRIAGNPGGGLDLRFSGTFPSDVAKVRGLLGRTITAKIAKSYARYMKGELWLLAYSQDFSAVDDESVAHARQVLHGTDHAFDAIWAFFPFPGDRGGQASMVFGEQPALAGDGVRHPSPVD